MTNEFFLQFMRRSFHVPDLDCSIGRTGSQKPGIWTHQAAQDVSVVGLEFVLGEQDCFAIFVL